MNIALLNENFLRKYFSRNQERKIGPLFIFDGNDVRIFKVFKWTAMCIFTCETKEMMFLAKMDF